MRNQKLWQILLLSALLVLGLVACGGGDEPEPEATEASSATEEEASDEPAAEEETSSEEMSTDETSAGPFVFGLIMVGMKPIGKRRNMCWSVCQIQSWSGLTS